MGSTGDDSKETRSSQQASLASRPHPIRQYALSREGREARQDPKNGSLVRLEAVPGRLLRLPGDSRRRLAVDDLPQSLAQRVGGALQAGCDPLGNREVGGATKAPLEVGAMSKPMDRVR